MLTLLLHAIRRSCLPSVSKASSCDTVLLYSREPTESKRESNVVSDQKLPGIFQSTMGNISIVLYNVKYQQRFSKQLNAVQDILAKDGVENHVDLKAKIGSDNTWFTTTLVRKFWLSATSAPISWPTHCPRPKKSAKMLQLIGNVRLITSTKSH